MNTKTTTVVHNSLLPLATLASGVTKTARRGNRVRLYRQDPILVTCGAIGEAIQTLLASGAQVRVYEQERIYTPSLDGDQLIWSFRNTNKCRDAVVVEVVL